MQIFGIEWDHSGALKPAQARALIDAAPTLRARAVLSLMYATGLRDSELCGLKIGDVTDWAVHTVRVRGVNGGHDDRIIYADYDSLRAVWCYLESRPQPLYCHWPLFAKADNVTPIRPERVAALVGDCAASAELPGPITPDCLRLSFAVNGLRRLSAA